LLLFSLSRGKKRNKNNMFWWINYSVFRHHLENYPVFVDNAS